MKNPLDWSHLLEETQASIVLSRKSSVWRKLYEDILHKSSISVKNRSLRAHDKYAVT
jgi:hypothetical protein